MLMAFHKNLPIANPSAKTSFFVERKEPYFIFFSKSQSGPNPHIPPPQVTPGPLRVDRKEKEVFVVVGGGNPAQEVA